MSVEAPMPESSRLTGRGSFRLGLASPYRPNELCPLATIGMDSQGGVLVAPVDVHGEAWEYGIINSTGAVKIKRTEHRPKLMWHRTTGEVSASLKSPRIERVPLELTPLDRPGTQLLSIVACWPFEFTKSLPTRKRDAILFPRQSRRKRVSPAPVAVWARLRPRTPEADIDWYHNHLGPVGLVRARPGLFLISLAGYGASITLECEVGYETRPGRAPNPKAGISVVASDPAVQPELSAALWSESQRHPIIPR